jgi:hypothetical protein
MRFFSFFAAVMMAAPLVATAQQAETKTVPQIYASLAGHWTGLLNYRDFTTDASVTLPTELDVVPSADGRSVTMNYTFQDGPKKVVHDTTHVTVNPATRTWTTTSSSDPDDVYQVEGLDSLQDGLGKLTLRNIGTENGKKVDTRTEITIGRTSLLMERQTKLPGEDFKFRHVFQLTRAENSSYGQKALPPAPVPAK